MIRSVKKPILGPKIIKFYTLNTGLIHLGQVRSYVVNFTGAVN